MKRSLSRIGETFRLSLEILKLIYNLPFSLSYSKDYNRNENLITLCFNERTRFSFVERISRTDSTRRGDRRNSPRTRAEETKDTGENGNVPAFAPSRP